MSADDKSEETSYPLPWIWSEHERREEVLKTYFNDDLAEDKKKIITNYHVNETIHSTIDKYVGQERIKFNAKSLDDLTKGGIDVGLITEFYGLAGSGKTQLCLQLALNCQLPRHLGGLEGKVVYISSDKHFPVRRLEKIALSLQKKAPDINFLDNVFVYEFNTVQAIEWFIKFTMHDILVKKRENIKLVIIDSIAGIYRSYSNYQKRYRSIRKNFHNLAIMARRYKFGVITTNHVTTKPADDPELPGIDIPALGITWTKKISTRMLVTKMTTTIKMSTEEDESVNINLRTLKIEKSPRLPHSKAYFVVTSQGIKSMTAND